MDKIDLVLLAEVLGVSALDLAPCTPKWNKEDQTLTLDKYVFTGEGREVVDENGAAEKQEVQVRVPDSAVALVERLVEYGLIDVEPEVPRLTRRQAAIIGAYTAFLCGPFVDVHRYIEEVIGRPVWTHELADRGMWEEIREAAKEDFIALCHRKEAE